MKQSVLHYDIRPVDVQDVKFQLQPEPTLRFTNSMGRATMAPSSSGSTESAGPRLWCRCR